ncbi:hypothetical protein CTRI78_v011787 [Colletotrichum trifolii]|uniref:Uncharacterized protein n=1 Tax=Colletotrichum trifolii TaxID=5466 RepID=A0A4R8Q520_COLTR|nr:hypothetical protein CTRI78_v011787 [Colletotrichum trifolii]
MGRPRCRTSRAVVSFARRGRDRGSTWPSHLSLPASRHIVESLISTICSVRWEQCRGCGRRAGSRGTRSGCPSGGRVGRWSC